MTYVVHTAPQHPQSGCSQQHGCHRGSQLVWTHIQYKQHHLELWWQHCFAQSVHWNKQSNLCRSQTVITNITKTLTSLHTRARVSKLSTSHIGIQRGPMIMAHCPPVSIQTHLHPPIRTSRTTSQSDIALSTPCKIDNASVSNNNFSCTEIV